MVVSYPVFVTACPSLVCPGGFCFYLQSFNTGIEYGKERSYYGDYQCWIATDGEWFMILIAFPVQFLNHILAKSLKLHLTLAKRLRSDKVTKTDKDVLHSGQLGGSVG